MTAAEPSSGARDAGRPEVEASISIRTILLVAATVAVAWALGSVTDVLLVIFVFIWIRTTLPRLRYDQLMAFGWKVLLPVATINALVTAALVVAL